MRPQIAETGSADEGVPEARKPRSRAGRMIATVYVTLANLYTRLRRFPEAEEATEKAASLSTKQEEKQGVDFLRGSIFERQKKYDQAEDMFRKVLST